MEYVALHNGVDIPQLGYGTWLIPDDEAAGAVATALEVGYRHVDTAEIYENERGVGRGLAESGVPRTDIFLTTKVWNSEHGFDNTLRAFDASLARLGTYYVDLYLIHWPVPGQDLYVDSWRALERIAAEGRARAIGVSNFHAAALDRLIGETGTVPVINQIELHPYFTQQEMLAANAKHGIVTEAWSPLGHGGELLTDPVLVDIGAKYGKSPAQVVLRWHLQQGNVVFPKSVTPSRIRENFDVFDFTLDDADMAAVSGLDRPGGRFGPDPESFNYLGRTG